MGHNVIQRPELLRILHQRLGIGQAHIAPTLNEGVQAVYVIEDSLFNRESRRNEYTGGYLSTSGDPGPPIRPVVVALWNPSTSGVILHPREFRINIPPPALPSDFDIFGDYFFTTEAGPPFAVPVDLQNNAMTHRGRNTLSTGITTSTSQARRFSNARVIDGNTNQGNFNAFSAFALLHTGNELVLTLEHCYLEPGWGLWFSNQQNQTIEGMFRWEEQNIEPTSPA